jgi:hypothetical protein
VTSDNLNTHLNHAAGTGDPSLSMAFPEGLAVSADGKHLYAVAQGSSKLAVYATGALEAGSAAPSAASQLHLSGGGPTGVVLDESQGLAFVLTRFDDGISTVDLSCLSEVQHVKMFSPEPPSVTAGRVDLYDATKTSALGDQACASCHIGGDFDGLAWDLGNPGNIPLTITHLGNVFTIDPAVISALLPAFADTFKANNPLKGPMTTQSLRGLDNHGAMHWRGDRNGAVNQDGSLVIDPATGSPVVSAQPNAGLFDEVGAFNSFNVAFPGLVGNDAELSPSDMLDFTTFALQVTYPPNPIRNLDNSLTEDQKAGEAFFFNHATKPDGSQVELPSDRFHNCNGCHTMDRSGNLGATAHPGFFGTDGKLSFEFETQIFKVPHLRNLYQKVGMFGSSPDSLQPGTLVLQVDPATGQPIVIPATRGFGFQHDGSLGTLEHFFTGQVFLKSVADVIVAGKDVGPNPYGIPFIDPNALPNIVFLEDGGFELRRKIVAYLYAFDSNLAPIVGQQVTLTAADAASANPRIDLLEARATAGECDLVARGGDEGAGRSYLFTSGAFQSDRTTQPPISDAALRATALGDDGNAITYTCVPPGAGVRIALDRDGDGWADGDELAARTNPADANSHP